MIISIGANRYTVGVKSYDAQYDSGIEWRQIGGKHKALDRGIATAKWSSDVTIRALGTVIAALRADLLSAKNDGTAINVYPETHETIFGPEFSYASGFQCYVDPDEDEFDTGNLNLSIPLEWTITLAPITYMPGRYLFTPSSFPSTVTMVSASRLDNGQQNLLDSFSSRAYIGYGFSAPTAEIIFEGDKESVAKAKAYLQGLRGSSFSYSAAIVWPFNIGITSETVYCLDVEDVGPLDIAGLHHSFVAVFGKA